MWMQHELQVKPPQILGAWLTVIPVRQISLDITVSVVGVVVYMFNVRGPAKASHGFARAKNMNLKTVQSP